MAVTITQKEIVVDGKSVPGLLVSQNTSAADLVKAIALPGLQSVILLFGGADQLDDSLSAPLESLLTNGLLAAAVNSGAVIIDGGTKAGVMQLMGKVLARQEQPVPLIGVAPEAQVNYDGTSAAGKTDLAPGHDHFVLVKGGQEWGSETSTIFKIAQEVLAGPAWRLAAVLIGGGTVSASEILTTVRNRMPVFVISGSGGFADKLAAAKADATKAAADPVIAEILKQGELCFFALGRDPEEFNLLLSAELGSDEILASAWQEFASFDLNAGSQQAKYKNYQKWILRLGVLSAALAITYKSWYPDKVPYDKYGAPRWFLFGLLVTLPVMLTTITAAFNKFKNGNKWIFFRAGAEAIKREIYSYRTRTGAYQQDARTVLQQRLSQITQKAERTDINHTHKEKYDPTKGFPPPDTGSHPDDPAFSRLDAETYIKFRVRPQLDFFDTKVKQMKGNLDIYNWSSYIVTGIGAILAVTEQQVWIALTTSIVAAIGNWLGYQQWENTLGKYNQCACDLNDIIGWWAVLKADEKLKLENITSLVTRAEQTLQNEYDGWAQQMQQTMEEKIKQQKADK